MSTFENISKNMELLERTGFPTSPACTHTQTGRHSGAFYETITLDGLVKSPAKF